MTVQELTIAMVGVKNEVLDIKEGLADYNAKISNVELDINQTQIDLSKEMDNKLQSYVKTDTLSDYYDKYYIDKLLSSIKTLSKDDVKTYLVENEYITKSSLGNYTTNTNMMRYVDGSLMSYLTIERADSKYVTKSEFDNIISNNEIDLTDYVKSIELKDYYTKNQIDSLIPSLSGYVKKSELFGILPFDNYALKSYVKENFVRKGEISMDGYVTTNMLNSKISSLGKVLTISDVDDKLDDYVKTSDLDKRLSQQSDTIFKYVTQEIENCVNKDELKIKLEKYVTYDALSDYIIGNDSDDEKGIDLSNFVKISDLKNYVKIENLNETKSEILNKVSKTVIPNVIKTYLQENGYKDENYLYQNFMSHKNFRDYLESLGNNKSENDETIDSDSINIDSLSDYVLKTELDEKLNILSGNINSIIPITFNTLTEEKGLVTKTYTDSKYATKLDLIAFESLINDLNESKPDMSIYVKKSQLSDYVSKSEADGSFVNLGTFTDYKTRVNTSITDINNTFKKYVPISTLGSYLRVDDFNNILVDYVTKDYLNNEIKNITNNVNNGLTNGDDTYLTTKDYERMKTYVSSVLQNYAVAQEIYSYVSQNFVKNVELTSALDGNYYTKDTIDSIFLTKTNAESTYLTKSEALSDYLSKEDYRGIKNAMTLNSAYRDAENIFDALIESGKLNDGFYIVGDGVVVVKDGQKFSTPNMTGSGYITENELINKDYITRIEFEENKGKNWITDTGGNY